MVDDKYAAGIFDGEGCVLINKRSMNGRENPDYNLRVSIAGAHKPMIEAMRSTYGGSVHAAKRIGTRKQVYHLVMSATNATAFLQRVYPYLMEKKAQAWLALEFQSQRTNSPGIRNQSAEELALREGYHLALKNAKGRDN